MNAVYSILILIIAMVEIISDANLKDEGNTGKSKTILNWSDSFNEDDDEDLQETEANEALLAKVFASISTIKVAYAELQYAQSPFDPDGIEALINC